MNNMITGPLVPPHVNFSVPDEKSDLNINKKEIASVSTENKLETKNSDISDKEDKNPLSLQEMQKIAVTANKAFNVRQSNLEFSVDDSTKEVVMSLRDKETGEVIRQFPSQEALDMLQRFQDLDKNSGLFVQHEV